VNRYIPASKEHQFRYAELQQLFGPKLLSIAIEEHSAIQQAQGAARPIHSWPGEIASKMAQNFEDILEKVFEAPAIEHSSRSLKRNKKATKSVRIRRGSSLEAVLNLDED
jgi:cellulose biosynthesis protein BcsQ